MYQTLKYIFVRIGISLFLLLTFGFLTLYFIHEVALPRAAFDDSFIQAALFFICLFLGVFAYGLVGEQKFHNAMFKLKNIPSAVESEEVIDGFQMVLDFTYSSYFLPGKGKRLRDDVILKFANYLLFVGRKDDRAQKIYLKAFLLRPEDSSYRAPLLSVFKEDYDLTSEEVDLLLVILKAEDYSEDSIVNNLASLFLRKRLFESKTEPIFLASLKNKSENSKEIVDLVLPQLLRANRLDSFAVRFYLEAYRFEPSETSQVLEMIARAYCEKTWEDVDKVLHLKCEEVFQNCGDKFRSDMLSKTAEFNLSSKIHHLRLLNENDLRLLQKLKVKMGLSMSFFDLLKKIVIKFFGFTRILASKLLIIRTWIFIMVAIFVISLVYRGWQTQKEMTAEVEGQAIDGNEKKIGGLKEPEIHTFQIAAFSSSQQARELINLLKKKGVRDVYQVRTKKKSGETWYKIRVGRFDSKENAQRFARQLIEQKTIKTYFLISLPIS
jgi:hypothetical protein